MNILPVELKNIAKEIHDREEVIQSLKKQAELKINETVSEVILQGASLNDAKSKVKGSWDDWRDANCRISKGAAIRYMKVAKYSGSIRQLYFAVGIIPDAPKPQPSMPSPFRFPDFDKIVAAFESWDFETKDKFKQWYDGNWEKLRFLRGQM